MTLRLHDLLFIIGAGISLYALFATSWQAGMLGIGLAVIVTSWIVRGVTAQNKRRRK